MSKAAEAFRTISEVADDLEIPKHVLRFWEVKFTQIRPMKRGGGRRYYRPEDMELLRGIRHLLHREGYTIKGVQKILKEQGIDAVKVHGRLPASDDVASSYSITKAQAVVMAAPGTVDASHVPQSRVKPAARRATGAPPTAASAASSANSISKANGLGVVRPDQRDELRRIIAELEHCRAALLGTVPLVDAQALPPVGRRAASGS